MMLKKFRQDCKGIPLHLVKKAYVLSKEQPVEFAIENVLTDYREFCSQPCPNKGFFAENKGKGTIFVYDIQSHSEFGLRYIVQNQLVSKNLSLVRAMIGENCNCQKKILFLDPDCIIGIYNSPNGKFCAISALRLTEKCQSNHVFLHKQADVVAMNAVYHRKSFDDKKHHPAAYKAFLLQQNMYNSLFLTTTVGKFLEKEGCILSDLIILS